MTDERVELYRRLPRTAADAWWVQLARRRPDGHVLELGAGAGRLTDAILTADPGSAITVTAVERDPGMVAALQTRVGERATVVPVDATLLPSGPPADLVTLATGLLNELPDAAARAAVLRVASERCAADGLVALHLLAPWWLVGMPAIAVGRLEPVDGSAIVEVEVVAGELVAWPGRRHATLSYRFDDGAVLRDHLDAAVVSPGELEHLLDGAGLDLVSTYGARPPDGPPMAPDTAWHVLARPRR